MSEMVPLNDDEVTDAICIVLAAYGDKFPQLRGKAVRPDLRDMNRDGFARLLVEKLRQSQVRFFKEVDGRPLMLDSGCFPPHQR